VILVGQQPPVTPTRPAAPSPSATPRATDNATPTPTVLAVDVDPDGDDEGADPITDPGGQTADAPRPQFIQSTPDLGDVSTDTAVILTNVALAALSLMLLVLSAEIFNQTVEENDEDIKAMANKYAGPVVALLGGVGAAWQAVFGGKGVVSGLVGMLAVLSVAGLIYGFEEDGFGMNEKSLVMFASMLGAVAILTYWYDGGQILMSRNFGVTSVIRLFPVGILIAALCLAITRVGGYQPGLVYGFVAAAVAIGPVALRKDEEGKVIFWPALSVLGLAVVAWLLVGAFRDLNSDSDSWLAAVPEGIAVGVFVGAISSLFVQMIPMRFMDGHKVWTWNKFAWALLAGISAVLLWHILLNTERSEFDAIGESTATVAIILMVICFGLSLAVWLFFRLRNGREPELA
jgi:hypothetical protein